MVFDKIMEYPAVKKEFEVVYKLGQDEKSLIKDMIHPSRTHESGESCLEVKCRLLPTYANHEHTYNIYS